MSSSDTPASGPDLTAGVAIESIPAGGALAGHVDGEAVLLSRDGDGCAAVSGTCTHYGAPLATGRIANGEVRCPWHHACFSLRTGEALSAPAFAALRRYRVDVRDGLAFVRADGAPMAEPVRTRADRAGPGRIVIVGGGAAGHAAAERLRALGHAGTITMLSQDGVAPCDRPNLSKDYLAGTAQADWLMLQPIEAYREHGIDLRLDCPVRALDLAASEVVLASGERRGYDALLLATGAEPVRLPVPGFDRPNVFTLRSVADADAIIAAAANARRAVLVGSGFIGLEAAGALRTRGLDVHVVTRDTVPLGKVLGREAGALLEALHVEHGVVFHHGRNAVGFDGATLTLDDGGTIACDLVLVGIGVKPRLELAKAAGLATGDGVLVDERLRTSQPGIYAAGDVAQYPLRGEAVRIEHWVHAQRQGQVAAANLLGDERPYREVPFFWTGHYDLSLRYVGHARGWDEVRIDGDLAAHDATARYYGGGRLLAALSVGRDLESLAIEARLRDELA